MRSHFNTAKVRKLSSAVLISLFFVLLWLPLLDSIFHLDKTPNLDENRILVPFPGLGGGPEGLRVFFAGVEKYYNDHFGFRSRLIQWERKWKRELLAESVFNSVIIGKNGWLYQRYEAMFPNAPERHSFTTNELAAWQALFEERRDWLASRGIQYAVVIPPSKQTAYPEYLPEWLSNAGPALKLKQFISYMLTNSTVQLIDLRPCLAAAKQEGLMYYLTDSHWNQLGAFYTCQEIIRALSETQPCPQPLSIEAFDRKFKSIRGGNLAQMLAATDTMPESNSPELAPRPPLPVLAVTRKDLREELFITCENPDAAGRVLIFCDSFADGWLPFMGYHFNRVILCRRYLAHKPPAHTWNIALIEREKPTLVIDEVLDAFLALENPAEIRKLNPLPPSIH